MADYIDIVNKMSELAPDVDMPQNLSDYITIASRKVERYGAQIPEEFKTLATAYLVLDLIDPYKERVGSRVAKEKLDTLEVSYFSSGGAVDSRWKSMFEMILDSDGTNYLGIA